MDYSSSEKEKMITYFTVLTSSSRDVARSFLETHQWNLFTAVSSYDENQVVPIAAEPNAPNPTEENLLRRDRTHPFPNLRITIPDSSLSPPHRSQIFPSSKRAAADSPRESQTIKHHQGPGNIRPLDDIAGGSNRNDSDEADQEENKDGEDEESSDDEEIETHEVVTFTVTHWRNGFSIDDSPLRTLDDPENEAFLATIQRLESPREIYITHVIKLIKREEEDFIEPSDAFQGVGRTLAESDSVSTEPPPLTTTTPPPPMGLVVEVDPAAPTTSIQLRLADGTRLVTLFNTHHTVRDVRGYIDASRPDGSSTDYQLLTMGFPPKPLSDLDQTIENAGILNSVLIQRF